ncbi:MAG: peptidoglycan editing factor PgeF [Sphingomicrobium sp.]
MSGVEPIHAVSLGDVPHGFLGRRGGVSTGIVAGLNVGSGSNDDPAAIAENKARAAAAIRPHAELATVHQVHSAEAVTVSRPWAMDERPRADALVTDRPGILLGVVTADCAPVLLADLGAGVIGAAHAGWRGALAGVSDSVIDAMERLGARRDHIHAAVGPCIASASYEVDADFRTRFLADDPGNGRFFEPGASGRPHFDLEAYVVHRLIAAGVEEVEALNLDTYADPDRFFSFRRSTHRGEPDYGRQLSAIALPG